MNILRFFLWVKWSICLLKQFTAKPKRSFQGKTSILAKGKPNRVSSWTIWSIKWHQIMFDDGQIVWSFCCSILKTGIQRIIFLEGKTLTKVCISVIILVSHCRGVLITNFICKNAYTLQLAKQLTATPSDKEAFVSRLWICKLNQGNRHMPDNISHLLPF